MALPIVSNRDIAGPAIAIGRGPFRESPMLAAVSGITHGYLRSERGNQLLWIGRIDRDGRSVKTTRIRCESNHSAARRWKQRGRVGDLRSSWPGEQNHG